MSKNTEIIGLGDLKPDPQNARKHTPRNVAMIVDAFQEVGAARSIVIDEKGVVLAGNATIRAASQAGLARVKVVDADGSEIIAVRRTNGAAGHTKPEGLNKVMISFVGSSTRQKG
jgi:ParB-like chromosome segregation protein Spo0J